MFKKNDYIVVLDYHGITSCAKLNYIFKQKHDALYISPDVDLKGARSNNNTTLKFDRTGNLKDWRYAYDSEIEAYNKAEKPIDISYLKSNIDTIEENLDKLTKKLLNV